MRCRPNNGEVQWRWLGRTSRTDCSGGAARAARARLRRASQSPHFRLDAGLRRLRLVERLSTIPAMPFTDQEILETVRMIELETLDIRTITLGINLLDCADPDVESACEKIYAKIVQQAKELVAVKKSISADYGIPIVNQRIATTPISLVAASSGATDLVPYARAMDAAAEACGIDFIGGFTAYVQKGFP